MGGVDGMRGVEGVGGESVEGRHEEERHEEQEEEQEQERECVVHGQCGGVRRERTTGPAAPGE